MYYTSGELTKMTTMKQFIEMAEGLNVVIGVNPMGTPTYKGAQ